MPEFAESTVSLNHRTQKCDNSNRAATYRSWLATWFTIIFTKAPFGSFIVVVVAKNQNKAKNS